MKYLCILVLFLTGCMRSISPNEYTEAEALQIRETYKGVIISIRPVTVKASDKLEDNGMGLLLGSAGGALVGSQFGKGDGQVVGTIIGAIAGAVGGMFAEDSLKTQEANELTIELANGELITVAQGKDIVFHVGQKVLVHKPVKGKGRVRIVPLQSDCAISNSNEKTVHPLRRTTPQSPSIVQQTISVSS